MFNLVKKEVLGLVTAKIAEIKEDQLDNYKKQLKSAKEILKQVKNILSFINNIR